MKNLILKLKEILRESQIHIEEPMCNHITFKVGGKADLLVTPEIAQIKDLLALARESEVPVTVIGNGSNLLVGDKGIRGLVLELGKDAGNIKELSETSFYAEAGCMLSAAARRAYDMGLGGMEFAAGIPGTVGGAVVMNAGAYGGEIKDVLESATLLTSDLEIIELGREELELSYRHSIIPEKGYIVLGAKFVLSKADKDEIKDKMDDFRQRRISKQPLEYPSAGSTFKRPEGYFAGKLIEDAGLRGYQVGGAQVSEKHCGFVINKDQATAQDIRQLMADVSARVKEEFGVNLEAEVKAIGEF